MTNSEPRSLFALSQKLLPRDGSVLAPPPLSITYRSERKRAIYDFRHFLQTMSLMISCIVFALIITINISCTASRRQKARVFAMPLPRIGVVELTNAPYPKHVPFTGTSALTNIAVTQDCCLASHWILVHNTFEGVVTNYRRAVD